MKTGGRMEYHVNDSDMGRLNEDGGAGGDVAAERLELLQDEARLRACRGGGGGEREAAATADESRKRSIGSGDVVVGLGRSGQGVRRTRAANDGRVTAGGHKTLNAAASAAPLRCAF